MTVPTDPKRPLGSFRVSPVGLGCMNLSHGYGEPPSVEQGERLLLAALDAGVTLFDTAALYGFGRNETLVGRVLKARRRDIVLCTKGGMAGVAFPDGVKRVIDGRPEAIRRNCEDSLRRLQTDVIDLYYLHRWHKQVPIEESVGAMADLVRAGKVRAIGLSEVSAATLRKAHAVHPIAAVQSEYSLWSRDPEDGVLAACRELGVGFVPYSPLGRGFLTGQITKPEDLAADDYRRHSPRFQGENFTKNLELVAKVKELAAKKHCTPGQLALAWVLAQGNDIVPIPGTKRRTYLDENLGALDVVLSKEDLNAIDAIAPRDVAAGLRYPAAMMGSIAE